MGFRGARNPKLYAIMHMWRVQETVPCFHQNLTVFPISKRLNTTR